MKYMLNAINQVGIVNAGFEKKTDVIDWLILDYIFEWKNSPKALILNDMVWLSYKHFINEMPLLHFNNKSSVSNRIKKIKDLGLIETYQNPDDMRLYAKTSALYYEISKFQASPTPVPEKEHPFLKTNTPVPEKEHPVPENEHSTDILINSNTIEQGVCVDARAKISLPENPEPAAKPADKELTAGIVCKKLRELGLLQTNPANTKLLDLLADGATMLDFEYGVHEAKNHGADFPYALKATKTCLDERLEKQRNPPPVNTNNRKNSKQPAQPVNYQRVPTKAKFDAIKTIDGERVYE